MRMLRGLVVVGVMGALVFGSASRSHATGTWMVGASAGGAVPMGNFGDGFDAGFNGSVSADYRVSDQFAVGFEAGGNLSNANSDLNAALNLETRQLLLLLGATTASSDLEAKATLLRFGVHGKWMPSTASVKPFLEAGAGLYRLNAKVKGTVTADGESVSVDESDNETKAGIQGGGGIMFAASPSVSVGVGGQFHNVFTDGESTQFFTVAAMVQFMTGGGGN